METIQTTFERYEKKYALTWAEYHAFKKVCQFYLQADKHPKYTVHNVYFDTPNFDIIKTSIEKPLFKEKLRLRSYKTTKADDIAFLELKKKFNHVVYKRRIDAPYEELIPFIENPNFYSSSFFNNLDDEQKQIKNELQWFINFMNVKPAVFIAYDREAYSALDNNTIRITFDTNIRWRNTELDLSAGDWGSNIPMHKDVLMEIKIGKSMPLNLVRILSSLNLTPVSFSKYGTCYTKYLQTISQARIRSIHCA